MCLLIIASGVSDPLLSTKAASFFLENKQYDKAVELFIASRQCRLVLVFGKSRNLILVNKTELVHRTNKHVFNAGQLTFLSSKKHLY